MPTGITKEHLIKEIASQLSLRSGIETIYGFGSFFRQEQYNDIDVLIVFFDSGPDVLPLYYEVLDDFAKISKRLGKPIDVTVLTKEEFARRPLLEMDNLVTLLKFDEN